MDYPALRRQLVLWGLYFAFWTLVGLAYADDIRRYLLNTGQDRDLGYLLLASLPDFYIWAMLSPLVYLVTKRWPVYREHWLKGLLVHIPLSFALYALAILLIITLDYYFLWSPVDSSLWTVYRVHLTGSLWSGMLIAWGIIAFCHALVYAEQIRRREKERAELETELLHTQLQVLRMQLQPHFLFNTLHAISTLMHRDVDAAERMLIRLADLLRLTLEHRETQEVTLEQELRFLDHYLQIERVRFGERLQVDVDAAPETSDALLPCLLLQPIVENAIKHGISPITETGLILLTARRAGERLDLRIQDNGVGLPARRHDTTREGVGLSTTRLRLEHLYGKNHQLDLANHEAGGLRVSISIPWRVADNTGGKTDDSNTDR